MCPRDRSRGSEKATFCGVRPAVHANYRLVVDQLVGKQEVVIMSLGSAFAGPVLDGRRHSRRPAHRPDSGCRAADRPHAGPAGAAARARYFFLFGGYSDMSFFASSGSFLASFAALPSLSV
jgi:hypothetical protein